MLLESPLFWPERKRWQGDSLTDCSINTQHLSISSNIQLEKDVPITAAEISFLGWLEQKGWVLLWEQKRARGLFTQQMEESDKEVNGGGWPAMVLYSNQNSEIVSCCKLESLSLSTKVCHLAHSGTPLDWPVVPDPSFGRFTWLALGRHFRLALPLFSY